MPDASSRPTRAIASPDPRRIVVVGPCASGKTTLVDRLRALGYHAAVSGQEHSAVRDLWRHTDPDIVVALDVDLATIRRRRSPEWSETIYRAQRERLARAFDAADLVIDSTAHDEDAVVSLVTAWLEEHGPPGERSDLP